MQICPASVLRVQDWLPGFFVLGRAMNENNTTKAVAAIATRSNAVGFDATLIISALIPVLLSCFKRDEQNETPKAYLEDHFDEHTGTFDASLINRCRPQTRRAARADGQRRLTREQLDLITVQTLEHARTMPDEQIEAVAIECGLSQG